MTDPIVKSVQVKCSAEHAFNVWVSRIADWWPLDTHAVSLADGKSAQSVEIEPFVGGGIIETKHDGSQTRWGTVQEFVPAKRFAMTWHPGYGADKQTLVEVSFTATATGATVTLTHSGWQVWGDDARNRITGYVEGWAHILGDLYAPICAP